MWEAFSENKQQTEVIRRPKLQSSKAPDQSAPGGLHPMATIPKQATAGAPRKASSEILGSYTSAPTNEWEASAPVQAHVILWLPRIQAQLRLDSAAANATQVAMLSAAEKGDVEAMRNILNNRPPSTMLRINRLGKACLATAQYYLLCLFCMFKNRARATKDN